MTTWDAVTSAVGLALSGDRQAGRSALLECWTGTTSDDHAHRCVLAHYLADLEDEVADEVGWDERALALYAGVRDDDLAPAGIASSRGLAPSLHLNLGDGYLRQGRIDDAAAQLAAGLGAQDALVDDGYGELVRRGLAALERRLDAARSGTTG
ncbi:hypothetical protein CLV56_1968 [Mumia flava]|uniref:Tetratricopeptide repeat protein n=1 Tax=Mumia flava TaxID=1348852 RepID=A0A0B2B6M6_9ACTN|nr:hypothetical protein [Mumia flava]PJJ57730.1 hypothetical protein CLV56_1968 [Mumia flava]